MKKKKINDQVMLKTLNFLYDKTVKGFPKTKTAEDLAKSYMVKYEDVKEAASKLVNGQLVKSGSSGLATGFPGILVFPIALSTDVLASLYIQIRMVAALAYIGGYDIETEEVKAITYMCLCGDSAKDIAKDFGLDIEGQNLEQYIKEFPRDLVNKLNKAVVVNLLTTFIQNGALNFSKLIPVIGGFVGAGIDVLKTKEIGKVAIEMFILK
ncbi:EcsC family protein [Haloplasma contractile]|uniref:EcsC protein n=1 Tax=Haloplasma contractile SSD-17B TaxID=1033810 RepID=U2E8J7_9MOLU|nr:EcsC family protein [Haloplasma contractile]ERJ11221.1 EcsC protein [Haloplasma contractile SSD-17B]